jgi:glycosyltransferase involved in cell wall biosynthesis
MRVLRIDSWEGDGGGGQEYVRSVSDELTQRGHPQHLLNLVTRRPASPRPDEEFVLTAPTPRARLAADLGADASLDRALRAAVSSFRPDLVHLHRFDAMFTPIARSLSSLDLPVVFTAHDAELVCPISTLILPGGEVCEGGVRPRCMFTGCRVGWGVPYNVWQTRVLDRELAPRIAAFLCPSALLATYLHRHGYRPAIHLPPFARIPDAVRTAAYPPPEASEPPTIGYLGRLEPYKGVQDLLQAMALLAPTESAVRLTIAGDGSFRAALEQLARTLGVSDRVVWRGDLRGPEKEEWFRTIDVLAVPSNAWENFGLVALEALTRGRPVVATEFGGLPDVVQDRETGRLVPVSDPPALAEALAETLADRGRAAAWAKEGRRRSLERFTPELHVERLLAVYRAVLARQQFDSPMEARSLVARAA